MNNIIIPFQRSRTFMKKSLFFCDILQILSYILYKHKNKSKNKNFILKERIEEIYKM